MPDAVPATDTVLVGRYRLVRALAQGGMAQVWEAHDQILDRPVAVKVLHAHLAADAVFIERFRREAIAAARLSHRNIIATYDTGTDGDVAFIVMELIRGRTLAGRLAEEKVLGPGAAVAIAAQVADALDYAHRAGIVHRDIKPANILLCDDGQVKVSDFGIAKAVAVRAGADLTEAGSVLGTMKYLSPEQVDGRPQDGRSDVYALGVVLYEMLTGRAPFVGDTDLATAAQHLHSEPVPPRKLRAAIPRGLETIVLKAMAKDPEKRYPSAHAFARALTAGVPDAEDATVLVARDPTPPGGTTIALPARAAPARTRRGWIVPVAVISATAVVVGVMIFIVTGLGGKVRDTLTPSGGAAVAITGAQLFDPGGDGEEHNSELPNLFDGSSSTVWRTHTYADRRLAGVKPGVGVIVRLSAPAALKRVTVDSQNRDWSASVYVADAAADTLEGWGQPVAQRSGITGDPSFDLHGRRGGAVLLWITDVGDANALSIGEIRVTS